MQDTQEKTIPEEPLTIDPEPTADELDALEVIDMELSEDQSEDAPISSQEDEKDALLVQKDQIIKEAQEKYLRLYAEMENYKKRKELEKADAIKFGNEKLVLALLPVLDSFDRAVQHAFEGSEKPEDALEGFVLIQKQFHTILEKIGVTPIEADNTPFDPNKHQAVMSEEKDGVESNTVIKVLQTGYLFHGKILRPSMVVVSK